MVNPPIAYRMSVSCVGRPSVFIASAGSLRTVGGICYFEWNGNWRRPDRAVTRPFDRWISIGGFRQPLRLMRPKRFELNRHRKGAHSTTQPFASVARTSKQNRLPLG